ncbi:MAG: hypothetical protein J07HB67_01288, partial [halophilic archaeon J07HB67]
MKRVVSAADPLGTPRRGRLLLVRLGALDEFELVCRNPLFLALLEGDRVVASPNIVSIT